MTLSNGERRLVALVCAAWDVDLPALDAEIADALRSGDLTIEQLNELTLHFAVYCGWPKASHLEVAVRTQWQRVHAERGEAAPPFPRLSVDDLGVANPAARVAGGVAAFEAINLVPAPPPDSPYFFAGILAFVFGHVWLRPGLTRRERRVITIPCVAVEAAPNPIASHVTSALESGDLSFAEMEDLIEQVGTRAGATRAAALRTVAEQWDAARR